MTQPLFYISITILYSIYTIYLYEILCITIFYIFITLNNNNKTISNNEEVAEIFNKHFSTLVESLNIGKTLANIIQQAQTLPILFLMFLESTNIIQV